MKVQLSYWCICVATVLGAVGCQQGGIGRGAHRAYNLPPQQQLQGPGPGVDGPGPGVIPTGGVMQTCATDAGCPTGPLVGAPMFAPSSSQIAFIGDSGLSIAWDVSGSGTFDSSPLMVPGRQDFNQGSMYRLRLTQVPNRPAVNLYPTLEVATVTPRTDAFLAHSPIPVQFTEEDFDQVLSGNFVTKVIYLPDPEFQELALAGVETLVSTRLDPGVDPVTEADRRGSILAILRMGNKDLETDNYNPAGVIPADYQAGAPTLTEGYPGSMGPGPAQMGMGMAPQGTPTGMAPQAMAPYRQMGPTWGTPMTATPIGLPGPPHIPLGRQAGLKKYTIKNRTRTRMPKPASSINISVKQRPGYSAPRPVTRARVYDNNRAQLQLGNRVGGLFSR